MQKLAGYFKRLLFPFSMLYWCVTAIRNLFFDWGWYTSKAFQKPVISVGNITVGGTGKTPHIELLLRIILQANAKPAVLSRGYKRASKGFVLCTEDTDVRHIGDEPMQIVTKFPDSVVAVCEKRAEGIEALEKEVPDTQCILLDDAFQHRWVTPSLSVLLVDYNRPIWNDSVFPVGMMREGFYARKRADVIIVSKCPQQLSPSQTAQYRQKLAVAESVPIFFTSIGYRSLFVDLRTGKQLDLPNTKVAVLTGIAQHVAFVEHLSQQFDVVEEYHFADHHYFSDDELSTVFAQAEKSNAVIVATEKDSARIQNRNVLNLFPNVAIYYLPIEPLFLFGEGDVFSQLILDHLHHFGS